MIFYPIPANHTTSTCTGATQLQGCLGSRLQRVSLVPFHIVKSTLFMFSCRRPPLISPFSSPRWSALKPLLQHRGLSYSNIILHSNHHHHYNHHYYHQCVQHFHPPEGLFSSLYYKTGDWMRAEAGLAASFSAGYDDDHNDFDDHNDHDDELKRGGPT